MGTAANNADVKSAVMEDITEVGTHVGLTHGSDMTGYVIHTDLTAKENAFSFF